MQCVTRHTTGRRTGWGERLTSTNGEQDISAQPMSRQCERLRQDDDVANLLAVVDVKTYFAARLLETVAIRGWAAGDQTTLRLLVPWS